MFNEKLFNYYLALKGLNRSILAKKMGIHEATLSRKIKRDGDFNREEIKLIRNILILNREESDNIFFNN